MLTPNNTLICVFSFNMGRTLRNCLKSIERHCPEFHIIIADDASDEPETLRVLDEWKGKAKRIYVSGQPKEGRRHGNLYANIQHACSFAGEMGYRFLFMVQDDMQFVLPLSGGIAHEYGALFNDEDVLSVDPRFARREAIYEIDHLRRCYFYPENDYRRSYADVGIIDLQVLRRSGWRFVESEPENKKALTERGFIRLFPYTPIMMHVPFPPTYRSGKAHRKASLLRRGHYSYHDLTAPEAERLRGRSIETIPYFRQYLRPKRMIFARLWYAIKKDGAVFR